MAGAAMNGGKEHGGGRTRNGDRIVQLVPAAPGWWVHFRSETRDDCWTAPIACWVLIEDTKGYQCIRGVDPTNEDWYEHGYPLCEQDKVVYFYSVEVPENANGISEPPLPER